MKASEYIAALEKLVADHGDLDVVNSRDEPVSPPEFGEADENHGAAIVVEEF